uniref:RIC3 domain-containing protein n=1 Tax=Panagrellus redivivus TaxID=6233 RepID=A0A7E4VLS4_PANRE
MPKVSAPRATKPPRRKRKVSDSEDEDFEGEAFPKWKIAMVVAVVFICILALWPTLLGPLINMVTGKSGQVPDTTRQRQPPIHPALNRQGAPAGPAGAGSRAHMHPAAMRMQGEAAAQQTTAGRGGMFSYLLPVYTIGVMVFLVYTLSKIMFKKKKTKRRRNNYDDSDMSGSEGSGDDEDENMGRSQLKALQKRLFETENAMSRILEQLEDISLQKGGTKEDKSDALSEEQVKTVEESMKQLSALSKVYKQQKTALEEEGTSEEDEEFVGDEELEEYDAAELNSAPSSLDISDDELEKQLSKLLQTPKTEAPIKTESEPEPPVEPKEEVIEDKVEEKTAKKETSPPAVPEAVRESKPKVRRRTRRE